MVRDAFEHCDKDHSSFKNMIEDAEKPLYMGSKHSNLSGLMKLYNIKGLYGWSDSGFSALLEVLNEILPNDKNMPKSIYEPKNSMIVLGLDYEKIHACSNDCILHKNEFKNLSKCPRCRASMSQIRKDGSKKIRKWVLKKAQNGIFKIGKDDIFQ